MKQRRDDARSRESSAKDRADSFVGIRWYLVSRRGHVMAQYSRFIRPGYVRVAASQPSNANVTLTAYKGTAEGGSSQLVAVAINQSPQPQTVTLDVFNGCAPASRASPPPARKTWRQRPPLPSMAGAPTVTLDGESVTTFVSE